VPHPALDAIAGYGVSHRPAYDEADARTGPVHRTLHGRNIVRSLDGVDDERGSTRSKPSLGRPSEVFRVVHSQQSRQHRVDQVRMSGGQAAAALAAPGRDDGAAGASPHPQTKAVGTATTPVARLECALAHGKTPTIFGVLTNQVRCSHGTHRSRSGQVAAVAVSDLLTVRGAAKPVKPARTWGDLRNSGRRCLVDTPNTMANITQSLASHSCDC
jgi:hypothetical protein